MQWHDVETGKEIEWCWVAPFDDMLAEAIELWIGNHEPCPFPTAPRYAQVYCPHCHRWTNPNIQ